MKSENSAGLRTRSVGQGDVCGVGRAPNRGTSALRLGALTSVVDFLCSEPDWTPTFDTIAASVVEASALLCSYVIPDPDGPFKIDPARVNVYAVEGTERTVVPNVDGAEDCGEAPGWYYDGPDAPRRVQLCSVLRRRCWRNRDRIRV